MLVVRYDKDATISSKKPFFDKDSLIYGPCFYVCAKDKYGRTMIVHGETKEEAIKNWNDANNREHSWEDL